MYFLWCAAKDDHVYRRQGVHDCFGAKKMIRGIMKKNVEEMKLFKEGTVIDDPKTLGDVGFTSSTARAQAPATIGLAFKQDDGAFEPLEITDLSTPPDLPEVMKPQESVSSHPQD